MPDLLRDELRVLTATIGHLREELVEHRGDVREELAKLKGVIDGMTQVKALEHEQLVKDIAHVRHRAANTESAVQVYADDVGRVKARIDRLVWTGLGIGVGSSIGGGGVVYALAQALGT